MIAHLACVLLLVLATATAGQSRVQGSAEDAPAPLPAQGASRATLPANSWVFSEQDKLTASDASALSWFGTSVSISGDTALVGAMGDAHAGSNSGAAYVFVRSGSFWTQQAKLTAKDASGADKFGVSVFLDGDTALIGAYHDDDLGADSGSAYVFQRMGTLWTEQAKLTPFDGAADDEFGISVCVDGDTAVIGAQDGNANGTLLSGAAYVFVRSGSAWSQQAKLTASDAASLADFGSCVSVFGNTALIGAPAADGPVSAFSGATYVFVRSGALWSEQAKLAASDGAINDRFGQATSLAGDTAVIGAYGDDHAGDWSGSAYVFVRSGTSWSEQAKLIADDATLGDHFGYSVSVRRDTVLIGAFVGGGVLPNSGSAYVFVRDGASWSQETELTASDGANQDWFGWSVSLSGGSALVGAIYDNPAGSQSGSAYVYTLAASSSFRNGGTNPVSYTGLSLPKLGGTYTGRLNYNVGGGHPVGLLLGYLSPLDLTLSGGQTILVNIADPSGEILQQRPKTGPIATWNIPVPADPYLAGLVIYTQGLHIGGGGPFLLSNARDLLIGY